MQLLFIIIINVEGFAWIDLDSLVLYVSANITNEQYDEYLTRLGAIHRNGILVRADLNARSPLWGDTWKTPRGFRLADFIYENNYVILNRSNVPTWTRGSSSSILDIAFCSVYIAEKVPNWHACEKMEILSDHRNIILDVELVRKTNEQMKTRKR